MSDAKAFRIRPGVAADYDAYTTLIVQLIPGDPIPPRSRFESELPGTFFAVGEDGEALGYCMVQHLGGLTYVRHLAVHAHARRFGLGRALMDEARRRAREAKTPAWILNVLPDNVPAIALYTSLGFREAFRAHALRAEWSVLEARFGDAPRDLAVRRIEPEDDARIEAETGLLAGQLAPARAQNNILVVAEDATGKAVGAASYAPWFPGAYPFKAASGGAAFALLAALRHYAVTDGVPHAIMNVVIENQPTITEILVGAGAQIRVETVRMEGPV